MEYVQLNNGLKMPMLGYGVYQVTNGGYCKLCKNRSDGQPGGNACIESADGSKKMDGQV